MRTILSRAGAAACVLALLPAGSQATAESAPPCHGLSAQDALGDISYYNLVPSSTLEASYDLEALYFRGNEANGAYSGTTAYIQVANLDGRVPAGSTSARWFAIWTDSWGDERFVSARIGLAGGVAEEPVVFEYGT